MRPIPWPLLIAVTCALCRADPPPDSAVSAVASPTSHRWDWRGPIRNEFVYSPSSTSPAPTITAPILTVAVPETPTDPEVVKLPPYEVRAKPVEVAHLTAMFKFQDQQLKQAKTMHDLGIGTPSVRIGPFVAGYVSVFYIPVRFTISLSW